MSNDIKISRELLSHAAALLSSVHSDVAHQLTALLAAPVVERQEPVKLQHMAVSEGGKLRWMTGRKMQDCELYALPDGAAIRSPLYAEQPAPVAVLLPDRFVHEHSGCFLTERQHGWNACLDKVKELNQ